uniref:C2H2-type domain-containing protein n=1 Tax=Anopheles stephensi TaxID=30069 RepID=A0A182YBR5_ANOST
MNPAIPVPPPPPSAAAVAPQPVGAQLGKSITITPSYTDDLSPKGAASLIGRTVSKTPPPPASSRLSLAKRRQSTFEFPVSDGKGNPTDQTVLVEVLGVCNDPEPGKRTSSSYPSFEPAKPTGGFNSIDNTLLEQASWSKEYCARVNNLMVVVSGTRPYKCKVCRRMFNNRTNLRRHIKALHADEVLEGESPPPECYGYGPMQSYLEQSSHHGDTSQAPVVKKKRKSTDPPITGPYKCEVCPRSFKMPAHLAVHRKTHRQIDFDQSELSRAIEQQKRQMQQQQRERSSSAVSSEVDRGRKTTTTTTTLEPSDIIQLSDDEEDEEEQVREKEARTFGANDDLDDGFDEEEGSSSKETSSLEADLRPDPSSLAIVEIGAVDADVTPVQHIKGEDEDVMVVQDGQDAAKPKPEPTSTGRTSIPPGPLSSKLKYQAASGGKSQQKPLLTARPIEDLQRKQQGSSSTSSATPSVHRCHLCRHTFPREDLLRDHQKSHQHDSPCAYRCGWCKKGFRYRQNYTLHLEKQTCRLINADPVRTMQQQQQQQAGKCT